MHAGRTVSTYNISTSLVLIDFDFGDINNKYRKNKANNVANHIQMYYVSRVINFDGCERTGTRFD